MLRCTLEAARRNNFSLSFLLLRGRMAEPDQKPDELPLASRFCARPFVIDASQQSARGPGNGLTVARMPQGKGKSGYPHEPPRLRLPLDHRFGMLRLGARVVVEVVMMRIGAALAAKIALHAPFHQLRSRQLRIWGLQNGFRQCWRSPMLVRIGIIGCDALLLHARQPARPLRSMSARWPSLWRSRAAHSGRITRARRRRSRPISRSSKAGNTPRRATT